MRLFDNDPCIGIEPRLRPRPKEQRLVDTVLALDGKGGEGAKTELGVQALGLAIVVQHRQVEVTQAPAHKVLDQVAHQHFADAGPRALRVDGQAPEAAAVFRVMEGFMVIEAHDAADYRAAVFILGQPVHRAALMARGQQVGIHRQHAAPLVQAIDCLPVGFALYPANAKATEHPGGRPVVGEPQAQGIGGVEEQLLRINPEDLLGRGHIQGDIPFPGLLVEQLQGQARRVGEGMANQ